MSATRCEHSAARIVSLPLNPGVSAIQLLSGKLIWADS